MINSIRSFTAKNFWIWRGPNATDDSGCDIVPNGYLHYAVFAIDGFPDLVLNHELLQLEPQVRTQVFADNQQRFLDALYKLCLSGNTLNGNLGFSWRYLLDPEAPFENKLSLYLIVRSFSYKKEDDQISHIAKMVPFIFPTDRGMYHPPRIVVEEREFMRVLQAGHGMRYMGEVRKKEAIFKPLTETPGLSSIYVPFVFTPQLNTMNQVCEALVKQEIPIVLDVNVVPTSLTEREMAILKTAVINYDRLKRDQKMEKLQTEEPAGGGLVDVPADPIMQIAFETFRASLNAYALSSVFLLSCRVLSEEAAPTEAVIVTMARNASREYDYELLSSSNSEEFVPATIAFQHCNISVNTRENSIWDHAERSLQPFRRLHRLAGSAEASAFCRFPIPNQEGVPGFRTLNSVLDTAETIRNKSSGAQNVSIGQLMLRGSVLPREEVRIPLKQLPKHGLVVGVPGSGKTTLIQNLVYQLWTRHQVPFLLIELAKTEYRSLAKLPGMEELLVFTLGDDQVSSFRLNPFMVLPGVSLEHHFAGLEECFLSALKGIDQPPLPYLLREALWAAYANKGWSFEDKGAQHSLNDTPTIEDVKKALANIAESKGYSGEIKNNIDAALSVRFAFLSSSTFSVGRMLNTKNPISVEDLFQRPVVLEMDKLNEEVKALMAMFVLNFLREHTLSEQLTSGIKDLRHLTVLEEAHSLIGKVPSGAKAEGDPKVQAVKYVVRMLAEMRALGVGVLVADQLPSALAPEVIKNTNVKVMHRLTSEDDRVVMGGAMLLSPNQFVRAATLNPGESFFFQEGLERPCHVKEHDFKSSWRDPAENRASVDLEAFTSDEEVRCMMVQRKKPAAEPDLLANALPDEVRPLYREATEMVPQVSFEAAKIKLRWMSGLERSMVAACESASCVCSGILEFAFAGELREKRQACDAEMLAKALCLLPPRDVRGRNWLEGKARTGCPCDMPILSNCIAGFIAQSRTKVAVAKPVALTKSQNS